MTRLLRGIFCLSLVTIVFAIAASAAEDVDGQDAPRADQEGKQRPDQPAATVTFSPRPVYVGAREGVDPPVDVTPTLTQVAWADVTFVSADATKFTVTKLADKVRIVGKATTDKDGVELQAKADGKIVGRVSVIVTKVEIKPDAGQAGTTGDVVPSSAGANGEKHYVSPKDASGYVVLRAELTPNTVNFADVFEWDAAVGSAVTGSPEKWRVKRDATGKFTVKVVPSGGGNAVDQMNVWIVWSAITATGGNNGSARGLLDVGVAGPPHENGFYANYTIDFTHTISPASIFTDADKPDLSGANTTAVPGDTQVHPGTGLTLAGGANKKWDNSRRIRAKLLNPANISTDHLISPPGLWTGFPAAYPATLALGNDDSSTGDPETNDPYANGAKLTGHDRVQLGVGDGGGGNGDTVEMRYHFEEFTRVQIGAKWFEISEPFPWRFHFKAKKVNGQWGDDGSTGAQDNQGW